LNLHLRSHWQNRDGAQNSDCEPTKVGIHKHASRVDFVPNSTAYPYYSFALTFPQLTGMGVMKTDKTTWRIRAQLIVVAEICLVALRR
jgi:hypothetical protein